MSHEWFSRLIRRRNIDTAKRVALVEGSLGSLGLGRKLGRKDVELE